MTNEARSHVLLRLASVLAVGAVACALLVGFFFDGDFRRAWRAMGGPDGHHSPALGSVQVEATGTARLQGRCSDLALVERVRANAEKAARQDAIERCTERPGASGGALSVRLDDSAEAEVAASGKACEVRVRQTWTCVFDSR